MKPGIAVNAARCMACYACFMACKDEHCGWASKLSAPQPHMGQFWMNIVEWERGDNERRIKTATVPTPCSHCAKPACMAAAKDGAVYKREDGIVIGRERNVPHIILLDHACVSREHVRLELTDDGLVVTDLGSLNGTAVNERELQPTDYRVPLRHGDVLTVGTIPLLTEIIR